MSLWREKRDEQEPEDLSGRIAVVLGLWTETFNRQWYEKCTGHSVEQVGVRASSALHPWRTCTLDGYVTELGAVFEGKHCSGFSKADEIVAR